jgi:ABC-2 type transport system ATP-binding protein
MYPIPDTRYSILVRDISKSYAEVKALEDISFEVKKGELFGFIGPDGGGKTTLFRIITTLLLPDKGTVEMEGMDVIKDYKKIRQIVGYMPGRFSLYQDLTVEQNLKFYATIFDTTIEENYHLIKDIYGQIEPFKKRLAGQLSGGMKQKLALSCAMIHKPVVLILDEPTTGVDAVSRKEFWEMLRKLKEDGTTIVVSTPYMDEANLCDRIALMQNGRIMAIDNPQNIIAGFTRDIYSIRADNLYNLLKDIQKYPDTHTVYPFGQYLHYTNNSPQSTVQSPHNNVNIEKDVRTYLENKGHKNIEIEKIKANIEDCFMELMNTNDQ